MKALLIATLLVVGLSSCAVQNAVSSIEYVEKSNSLVATGMKSPENSKLVLVCYNKYFNEERYPSDFLEYHKLNSIDYKNNMAVEIFLGETTDLIADLKVDKVLENKDNLNVYYSYTLRGTGNSTRSPFVIAQTPKSKKPVIFFENGKQLKAPGSNLYIKE